MCMEKKKKIYEQPKTTVTQVELESPICSGSAVFKGEEAEGVNIKAQGVVETEANDFSGNPWAEINSTN